MLEPWAEISERLRRSFTWAEFTQRLRRNFELTHD